METRQDLPRHDLRRNDRRACDHKVTVMWRDSRGQDKFAQANALDICELGLRLQLPEELPRHTYLAISAAKLGLVGHASVRHCKRIQGVKFSIGVEFTAGLHWTPKD
jgi:hypothetical protein